MMRQRWNGTCWRPVAIGLAAALCFVAVTTAGRVPAAERLKVHEWGTFTTLQDEHGREVPGVNVDDEPVPRFVHNLSRYLLSAPLLTSEYWMYRMKAAPRRHPLVTMRLETPVIYFYPPDGCRLPLELDVDVRFRGGWLTEFYPKAAASAPGLGTGRFRFGYLSEDTEGRLTWDNLRVGTDKGGPATNEHVWVAPRQVNSVNVSTPEGESERYLFYRGVGHLNAPLRVRTDLKTDELSVFGNFQDVLQSGETATIPVAWLVDIRKDGKTAFRRLSAMKVTASRQPELARCRGHFDEKDYAAANMGRLRKEMHAALVAEGLFGDEATAMLSTWERAYFKSAGRRLFFPVPRAWTERYLPLSISQPADITRVMIGRVELIKPEQRRLLDRLSKAEISDGQWITKIPRKYQKQKARLIAGRADFGEVGVEIPPAYRLYVQLGRFRNALVVHQERRHPTPSLTRFIDRYGLHLYRW